MTDRVDVLIRNLKFLASAAVQGGYQSDEEIDDSYKILDDGIRALAAENERLRELVGRLRVIVARHLIYLPGQSSPCTCNACRWVQDAQEALEGE